VHELSGETGVLLGRLREKLGPTVFDELVEKLVLINAPGGPLVVVQGVEHAIARYRALELMPGFAIVHGLFGKSTPTPQAGAAGSPPDIPGTLGGDPMSRSITLSPRVMVTPTGTGTGKGGGGRVREPEYVDFEGRAITPSPEELYLAAHPPVPPLGGPRRVPEGRRRYREAQPAAHGQPAARLAAGVGRPHQADRI
jgi:hypothetical protein